MIEKIQVINSLLDFIEESPTSYHAAKILADTLTDRGFVQLFETDPWKLAEGKSYFLVRNSSSVVAFRTGSLKAPEAGFHIIGAHTDSPGIKVKFNGGSKKGGLLRNSTEVYGGPILSSWLDRELAVAGMVSVREGGRWAGKLFRIREAAAVIPNLAIHLNRDVNKGFEYNKQDHLQAVFGSKSLQDTVAESLAVDPEALGESELFLYDNRRGTVLGGGLFMAPRIDNLAMCHASLNSLLSSSSAECTQLAVFYDSEEIGNGTYQGADSSFLKEILERIVLASGGSSEDFFRAKARSFMISADGAHGVHPNFSDKHDPAYAPVLNGGPVIKMNAKYKYATTREGAARITRLCEEAGVPYQKFIGRSDMLSGGTIGAVSSALLGIKTADIGNPMLAMHSIRETAGTADHLSMITVMREFYRNGVK